MGERAIDIASLSAEERLRLIGELWDSLSESSQAIPLSTTQEIELDRRLDALDSEGEVPAGIPWDEVLSQTVPKPPNQTLHQTAAAHSFRVQRLTSRRGK